MFNFFRKKEPVVINDIYGVFTLDEDRRSYSGGINWNGEEVQFSLYCDNHDSVAANIALENFHKIMKNAADWDKRLKERAVEDMVGEAAMIEVYDDDSDDLSAIPREEYIRRMSLGFALIYPDGRNYFDYDVPGENGEHGMGISVDISGESPI